MRLRGALRHLRALFGSTALMADAMGANVNTLKRFLYGSGTGSPALTRAAARAAGAAVAVLLDAPSAVATCPHCGASWKVGG